jgi:hypothetical protein
MATMTNADQTTVRGHRFERILLGMGMSVMLFVIERRVTKMKRADEPHADRGRHRS